LLIIELKAATLSGIAVRLDVLESPRWIW